MADTLQDGVRIEKDALGEVRVPADHLWGAQTQRSIENFPIGVARFRWGPPVIRAFGVLKKSAAIANGELGELPSDKVSLITRAAQEVIDGALDARQQALLTDLRTLVPRPAAAQLPARARQAAKGKTRRRHTASSR